MRCSRVARSVDEHARNRASPPSPRAAPAVDRQRPGKDRGDHWGSGDGSKCSDAMGEAACDVECHHAAIRVANGVDAVRIDRVPAHHPVDELVDEADVVYATVVQALAEVENARNAPARSEAHAYAVGIDDDGVAALPCPVVHLRASPYHVVRHGESVEDQHQIARRRTASLGAHNPVAHTPRRAPSEGIGAVRRRGKAI